ncbi:MAG: hypothetical protein PHO42_05775 [Candidatus Omnitrophica bacterium]|nr:hypothetical protein [Candidatus Omnitrophota bacterium]
MTVDVVLPVYNEELILKQNTLLLYDYKVPVEWIDDIRSTVHIPKTIVEDLAGLIRLRATISKKLIQIF